MVSISAMFLVLVIGILRTIVMVLGATQFNMSQYRLMPRVFQFDDYDACLRDDPTVPGVYCMVKAVVQPDESSSVWNVIAEHSSNWKQHLNHAHLDRGLCLQTCTQKLAKLERQNVTQEELDALVVPKFKIDFPYIIKKGSFRDVDEYRRNYSDTFAKCINYDLQREHGLRAYTEIEYCDNNTKSYPIDNLEIAFLVVLGILLLIVFCSSWYDHRCKRENGLSHYQNDLPSKAVPGWFMFGFFFYNNLFETPSAWLAVAFPLGRIFYTALIVLFIVGFIFPASKLCLRLANIHFFGVLGRLTYCAYLCHYFIVRATAFGVRRTLDLRLFEMTTVCCSTLAMSYLVGLLLCLTLELPCIALQKLLYDWVTGKRSTVGNNHLKGNLQKASTLQDVKTVNKNPVTGQQIL
uniref:Acyltransferase 3 domain-containing protein n=1 Tax=Anopheles atroparvus TaxID=41427 RepID=A0A182IKA0_ANOAO